MNTFLAKCSFPCVYYISQVYKLMTDRMIIIGVLAEFTNFLLDVVDVEPYASQPTLHATSYWIYPGASFLLFWQGWLRILINSQASPF